MSETERYLVCPNGFSEDLPVRYEFSDLDLLLPNIAVPLYYIFPLSETSTTDREAIVQRLKGGLTKTVAQFPIQAGRIYMDTTTDRRFAQRTSNHNGVLLYAKGVSEIARDLPSYEALKERNFPPNALSMPNLLPLGDLYPRTSTQEHQGSSPACGCQVTFIEGGLILGYAMNHLVADMSTSELFLTTWAANSKDGSDSLPSLYPDRDILTAKEVNTSQERIDEIEHRLTTVGHCALGNTKHTDQVQPQRPKATTTVVAFSKEAVRGLKAEVVKALGPSAEVSTWDCLQALIWRATVRAKLQVHPEYSDLKSSLLHVVGFRGSRIAGFPSNYFGNAMLQCTSGPTSKTEILGPSALPALAKGIRDRVLGIDRKMVDDLVHWAGTRGRPSARLWTARQQGPMDLSFTSWANVSCYQNFDFGFGLPAALRQPGGTGQNMCIYPERTYEDGIQRLEICVGFEPEVHEVLMRDVELMKYVDRYDIAAGM